MTKRNAAWLIAIALCVGCESSDPELEDDADSGPSGNALIGSFNVSLHAPSDSDPAGHTAVFGKVYDRPSPSRIVWEETLREDECQLVEPRVPFCSEPCGGSAVCVEDDVCQPHPKALHLGTVRVTGLETSAGDREFSMEPIGGTYQPSANIKLPFPAFEEGDAIGIRTAGGDLKPFTIEARGITPLTLASGELKLEPAVPLEVRWTAPYEPELSRIQLKLDISHHGGSKGMLQCELDDDGEAQLPAALITRLLDLGVAGFPSVILTRRSTGDAGAGPGRVELAIESKVERFVVIEGLSSCTSDEQCARGQTCRADLTCG